MLTTRISAAALAAALTLPVAARAQAPVVAPATRLAASAALTPPAAPAAASAARAVALPEGTEFTVVTAEGISSKTASEGDRVALKVDENVVVNGVTVIAKGASVRAVVGEVKAAGFMGRGGKLNLRVEGTTAVDGQRVALRASKAKVGDNKTGTTVALTVLFGPLGLLKKGKDASYPEGTRITVYTDEAVTVAAAPAAGQ